MVFVVLGLAIAAIGIAGAALGLAAVAYLNSSRDS